MEEQTLTQTIYVCAECGTKCSTKTNINVHMKRKHKDFVKPLPLKTIKCPLCNTLLSSMTELDHHFANVHDLSLKEENLQFNSLEEFKEWKLKTETNSQSSFVVLNSRILADKSKIIKYICHRSGKYTENIKNTKRKRQPKVKGSNKIGYNCPARIITKISCKGDIKVKYISTHVGHKLEVGRLRMNQFEREQLAGKMLQGVHNHKILKDLGENFNPLTRISYTTNHDLHNIRKSFKIESDVILHENDTKSVTILIEKLKKMSELDNPILLYKAYGLENSEIGKDNFLLIFMNSAQTEMLAKYGNNIVMIDSTHGTNPYKIQLATLMVVDEAYEGFPVAFLWSITQTEIIYQTFFSCIKEKLPDLKPRIFMSDDSNTFFNAFVKVYEHSPSKVLCDWHVKRNLNDNLSKIRSVEKRKEVKKNIKLLIDELDELTFQKMMSNLMKSLNNDEDTKKYGEYFTTYYSKRPEQWAHCYRKGFKKNTNMCLEKWHQELKHNPQMGGKCQRRLDVSINNVLECLRMKFLRRLVSISRNRVPYKLSELRKRHKIAEQFSQTADIFEDNPKQKWLVASSKNTNTTSALEYYTVERVKDTHDACQCSFNCNECKCCLHTYSCSCHDYAIQYNMCKHIHMVCIRYPPKPQENICTIEENNEEDSLLYIDENNNSDNDEHQFISDQLHQNTRSTLEIEKKSALEKLNVLTSLISNSNNLEEISYASKNFSSIISGINALKTTTLSPMTATICHPHNKNLELQNRRQSSSVVQLPLKSLKRNRKREVEKEVFDNDITLLNLVFDNEKTCDNNL